MENLRELAYYRSKIYGNLAYSYIYPPNEKIVELDWQLKLQIFMNHINNYKEIVSEIEESLKLITNLLFEKITNDSLYNILKEWTRLFRGVDRRGSIPPYESVFHTGRLQGKSAQQIYRLFSKMGITIPEEWHQPPDYIGVELDFMRLICENEMDAWEKNDIKLAKESLHIENSFIENHLGSWIGIFYENIKGYLKENYFRGIARLTKCIVEYDKILIPNLLRKLT